MQFVVNVMIYGGDLNHDNRLWFSLFNNPTLSLQVLFHKQILYRPQITTLNMWSPCLHLINSKYTQSLWVQLQRQCASESMLGGLSAHFFCCSQILMPGVCVCVCMCMAAYAWYNVVLCVSLEFLWCDNNEPLM